MGFVEPSPFKALHFLLNIAEDARYPINDAVEVVFQFDDVLVGPVLAHVGTDIALADPIKRALEIVLPVGAALDVSAPLLDVGVLAVAELGLCQRDKGARIDRVQKFLGLERNARDVDGLKPLLDLGFSALTDVNEHFGGEDYVLLILWKAIEGLGVAAIHDREFVCDEPPDARNALLAVQNLELIFGDLVEVNQPQRIALQEGLNDRLFSFAIVFRIDVVALILWLDGELASQTEQPFALELIINEALTELGYRHISFKSRFHSILPHTIFRRGA